MISQSMFAHIGPGNNRIKQVLVAGQISSRDYGRTNGKANLGDFGKMSSNPCGTFWLIDLEAEQALPRVVWVLLTVEVIPDRGKEGGLGIVCCCYLWSSCSSWGQIWREVTFSPQNYDNMICHSNNNKYINWETTKNNLTCGRIIIASNRNGGRLGIKINLTTNKNILPVLHSLSAGCGQWEWEREI